MINPIFFAIWFWSLALEGAIADLEVATGRRKEEAETTEIGK